MPQLWPPCPTALSDGSVLATPAAALGAFTIAANGEFVAPFSVPANWPLDEVHAVQFVALEPGPNTIWLSNAVVLHVNH